VFVRPARVLPVLTGRCARVRLTGRGRAGARARTRVPGLSRGGRPTC
jgi:hypothetical protein